MPVGNTHAPRDPGRQCIYATPLTGWIEEMGLASRLTHG